MKTNGLKTNDQIEYPSPSRDSSIARPTSSPTSWSMTSCRRATSQGSTPVVEIKEAAASEFTAVDAKLYKVDTTTGTTISFTRAGLDYLQTKPYAQVRVTYKAMANTITANGEIPNTANFYVNAEKKPDVPPQTPPEPPTTPPNDPFPTNTVKSSWGDLVITKTDKGNSKALSSATFQIYNAADPFAATAHSTQKATGDAIAVDGKTEFTTGADGTVAIEEPLRRFEGVPGRNSRRRDDARSHQALLRPQGDLGSGRLRPAREPLQSRGHPGGHHD